LKTVLTDVASETFLETFRLSEKDGISLDGAMEWSIHKRRLRGGLSEGVDVVELNNGGFSVTVVPTRGMGIWKGSFHGVPLGWSSPVALPVNPAYVNALDRGNLGWLHGFNEWLCRCGLNSHGSPGLDVVRDKFGNPSSTPLTLHGRIANIPAHHVSVEVKTEGPGTLSVTGVVDETMFFGPSLRLTSTIEMDAGSNRLRILDTVTNLSAQPGELELLYHTNFGPPFLEEGAKFVAPVAAAAPTSPRAAEGIDHWDIYDKPVAGYTEQCYFVDLHAEESGETVALLRNAAGDRGASLHFNQRQLPYFTIWKNTQAEADGYCTGIEPSTSLPNLKSFEREQGRVISLPPGASYEMRLEIAIHLSGEEVAAVERRIAEIQGVRMPTIHPLPVAKYTPGGA